MNTPKFAFKFALIQQQVNFKDGTSYTRYNVRDMEIPLDSQFAYLLPEWTTEKSEAVELVETMVHFGYAAKGKSAIAKVIATMNE